MRRVRRSSLAALGAALVALWALDALGRPPGSPAPDILYTLVEVGSAGLCVARALTGARDRLAWSALAAYAVLWTVGDLAWTLHFNAMADAPSPNWADAPYLASYAAAYLGLLGLLLARIRRLRPSLALDGLVCGLATAAACSAVLCGPGLGSGASTTLADVTSSAYVIGDMVLLCVVGVAFSLTGWRPGRVWTLIGASLVVTSLADVLYGYLEAAGRYGGGSWVDPLWPTSMLLLAGASLRADDLRLRAHEGMAIIVVPAIGALAALAVLVAGCVMDLPVLAVGLAAASIAAGGLRGTLTFAENLELLRASRREALTDGLTGLANRRALMHELDALFGRVGPGAEATLVFFDLDGFKAYNDAFGHAAGDVLLTRLSARLAATVAGRGSAYRLGGDEFCVLAEGIDDGTVLAAAGAALTENGEGFAIGASSGRVELPADADSADLALQLADERMYADKGSRRQSPRRVARDLLLQVLKEREPDLEAHVDDVGSLAVAVARRLGLRGEALDEVARGAELHDVGKIAVPDEILRKTGTLDAAEWQLMRQHTVVGERILAAAPALLPVARIVRSSHEHWDGSGYPDGLAGAAIPLAARIIAVCDAFDAMRQRRPYAGSMSEAAALAELRRCSGTQFDPGVVEAFAAVVAAGAGDGLRVA